LKKIIEGMGKDAMNKTLNLYKQISKFPLGKHIFSKGLTFRAPFFSTIHPLVSDLGFGFCTVEIKDRRSVRNHLGTINAGAMCTLSELTGGLAVEASIPSNLRWLPKEMTVNYTKKAKGKLIGLCSFDPNILVPGDIKMPIDIKDESGDTVLRATILFYISERPNK
jgi:acyl-coenzyme A thioesterase PaaI-like protein